MLLKITKYMYIFEDDPKNKETTRKIWWDNLEETRYGVKEISGGVRNMEFWKN